MSTIPLPALQERMFTYVLGPNQDSRLASVAAGAYVSGVELQLDSDAPFVLRSRAVRQAYSSSVTQNNLQFLRHVLRLSVMREYAEDGRQNQEVAKLHRGSVSRLTCFRAGVPIRMMKQRCNLQPGGLD